MKKLLLLLLFCFSSQTIFATIILSASDGSDIHSVTSTNIGGELGDNVLGFGLNENWSFGPYNDYDYFGEYLIIEIDGFATKIWANYAATTGTIINHSVMTLGFDSDGIKFAIDMGPHIDWRDDGAGVFIQTTIDRPFTQIAIGMIEGWAGRYLSIISLLIIHLSRNRQRLFCWALTRWTRRTCLMLSRK